MESIFLSFSFRDEDKVLVAAVEAILESQDITVATGEVLEGQPLTQAVMDQIRDADGLISLLTPRDAKGNGRYRPSTWVRDELNHARSINKPAIALVDVAVDIEGAYADRENILYDPAKPLDAFVKLSATIGKWKRRYGRRVKVRILPSELEQQIGQDKDHTECWYRLSRSQDGEVLRDWQLAKVRTEPGGAFAFFPGVQTDAHMEVKIQASSQSWVSVATPQLLHVELKRRTS